MELFIAALALCLCIIAWLHGYFTGEARAYEIVAEQIKEVPNASATT